MSEKYFPGFTFHEFNPNSGLYIQTEVDGVIVEEKILPKIPDSTNEQYVPVSYDNNPATKKWDEKSVRKEFFQFLRWINKRTPDRTLTMQNRTLRFVTPQEMKPKTAEARKWLIENYGEYAVDGGAGDCRFNENGTFKLRIGFAGLEEIKHRSRVLEVMAHEFGHTLGPRLEDLVFEEMKAYAFVNLFRKYHENLDMVLADILKVETVHETALFRLEQLTASISEEAIIAHLTGAPFAGYEPDDYLKSRYIQENNHA